MAEAKYRIIRIPDTGVSGKVTLWIYKLQERVNFFGLKWWFTIDWGYSSDRLNKKLNILIHGDKPMEVIPVE